MTTRSFSSYPDRPDIPPESVDDASLVPSGADPASASASDVWPSAPPAAPLVTAPVTAPAPPSAPPVTLARPSVPENPVAAPPAPPAPPDGAQGPSDAAPAPADGPARAVGTDPPPYPDPVDGLVHAAVADRPLEEVAQLITLLEQSPEYAHATVDALRAVGMDRSVEDVTRLVTLLTRPPRGADSADEAIRAAAECRPVEDVTRLVNLLHQPPLESHCAEEAVRAAATTRPVEELVQLIGRMAGAQTPRTERQRTGATVRQPGGAQATQGGHPPDAHPQAPGGPRERAARGLPGFGAPVWPKWVTGAALVLCALVHFPLHRDGASAGVFGFTLGASGLCLLLAVTVSLRATLPVLAAAVVVPGALAVAQLVVGRVRSPGLTKALEITAAPAPVTGGVCVVAALAALTALAASLSSGGLLRRPGTTVGQMVPAGQVAD